MSALLGGGGPKAPAPIAPPPQIDDAQSRINSEDAVARRQGRRTTVLTSESGLPNLGSTTKTGQ